MSNTKRNLFEEWFAAVAEPAARAAEATDILGALRSACHLAYLAGYDHAYAIATNRDLPDWLPDQELPAPDSEESPWAAFANLGRANFLGRAKLPPKSEPAAIESLACPKCSGTGYTWAAGSDTGCWDLHLTFGSATDEDIPVTLPPCPPTEPNHHNDYREQCEKFDSNLGRANFLGHAKLPPKSEPASLACPECSGTGFGWRSPIGRNDFQQEECSSCHGTGINKEDCTR